MRPAAGSSTPGSEVPDQALFRRIHWVVRRHRDRQRAQQLAPVEDLDGGPSYPILTGEYSETPAWRRQPVVPGTPVGKPTPVFTKLDDSIVEDELERLRRT